MLPVGYPCIEVVRPEPIQSTSSVRKVCLVGPTAGREGVFLHNDQLLGVRLRTQAFQTPDLLSPDLLNAFIGQWNILD